MCSRRSAESRSATRSRSVVTASLIESTGGFLVLVSARDQVREREGYARLRGLGHLGLVRRDLGSSRVRVTPDVAVEPGSFERFQGRPAVALEPRAQLLGTVLL